MGISKLVTMRLILILSVSLSVVLAQTCPQGDMVYACDHVFTCWKELDFTSKDELHFLCRIFDDVGGLDADVVPGSNKGFLSSSVSAVQKPIMITQAPKDRYIKPGETAEFTCTALNAAKVEMFQSGAGNGGRATGNEDMQTLVEVVDDVRHEDQGWVTCFAVQEGGSYALARAYLTVTDVCETTDCVAPEVCNPDKYSGSYTCETDGECPSECAVEYRPVCGSDCTTHINECFMRKMACQKGKKGVYVVSQGPCSFRPESIHFTENPEDGSYTEGSWFTFTAAVSAADGQIVQYMWYRGEELLGEGPELITNLLTSHTGEWEVKATSCHGRFEVSHTFNVQVESRDDGDRNGGDDGGDGNGNGDDGGDDGGNSGDIMDKCCRIHGEPHIETFDGKRYDYMGSCDYIIAEDLGGQWMVYGTYKACGDKTKQLSCIVSITVFYQNEKVQFLRMYRINYNGQGFSVPLGSTKYIGQMRIENTAMKYFIYLGDTGVRIMWDGITTSEICLVADCKSGVQGMCGNADGNPDNDFAGYLGSSAFGNRWAVGQNCDLEPEDGSLPVQRTRPCDFIPYEENLAYEARCNLILGMDVFSDCIYTARMDRDSMFANCMFDMCSGLTFGGGCVNRGDQRCDAETEARITKAILDSGMTKANEIAKYKPAALDPACVMGYNMVIQCSNWGVTIENNWTIKAECPTEEERRNIVICP